MKLLAQSWQYDWAVGICCFRCRYACSVLVLHPVAVCWLECHALAWSHLDNDQQQCVLSSVDSALLTDSSWSLRPTTTVQSATTLLLKSQTYYVSYQYNTCSCQYNIFTYNGLQVLLVKYLYNTIAGQFNTLYSCAIYSMIFYLQIPYYNDFRFYVIGLIFQLFVQLQYVSIHYLYYLIYFTYYRFMNQLQIL
jgi:hypothetical protein